MLALSKRVIRFADRRNGAAQGAFCGRTVGDHAASCAAFSADSCRCIQLASLALERKPMHEDLSSSQRRNDISSHSAKLQPGRSIHCRLAQYVPQRLIVKRCANRSYCAQCMDQHVTAFACASENWIPCAATPVLYLGKTCSSQDHVKARGYMLASTTDSVPVNKRCDGVC